MFIFFDFFTSILAAGVAVATTATTDATWYSIFGEGFAGSEATVLSQAEGAGVLELGIGEGVLVGLEDFVLEVEELLIGEGMGEGMGADVGDGEGVGVEVGEGVDAADKVIV